MAKPFTFSTKRAGRNIYVQFALPDGGRTFQKSTGTSNRKEAEKIAMEWLVNGNIPERINSAKPSGSKLNMDKLALFNNLKTYDFEEEDICKIIKILKDRKIIISAIRPKTKESILIDDILETFWNYEESPYVKSMAAETGKIISMSYCKTCESRVRLYWLPALKGKYIGEERDIPIPISDKLREELMLQAQMNPLFDGDESFIFFGMYPSKPACSKQWNKYLKRALSRMKYPNPKEICFHSWRLFFCSRMLDVIPDKRVVMALSGHKTTAMLDHYGKHVFCQQEFLKRGFSGYNKQQVFLPLFLQNSAKKSLSLWKA